MPLRPKPAGFGERYCLPREHGGWALLTVPPLVGFVSAGGAPWGVYSLFFIGALGAYLVRSPLEAALKSRGGRRPVILAAAYAAAAAAGFLPLVSAYGRPGLLLFAVAGAAALALQLWLGSQRLARSSGGELFGIAVLALGAPAAHYASRGVFLADGLRLWFLCAVFFFGPVFYVKMVVAGHIAASDKNSRGKFLAARRRALAYHAAAAGLISLLSFSGSLPPPAAVPFALALGKAAYRGATLPGPANLHRVGWQEVASSFVFTVLVAGAFAP